MHIALDKFNESKRQSYAADPGSLKEHFGIEQTVLAGGYGYRQILELVQNGADAILEAREQGTPSVDGNRIHVLLRNDHLYVANTGAPLSEDGLDSLLRSHSSSKCGNQIGRFGLGFKSLLKLGGRIDLFTRASGAIRFDPKRCRDELKAQFGVAETPGLRLAWPLEASTCEADDNCAELGWAETIVRIEVPADELLEHLRQEIRDFPAEFLLFFPVPTHLTLDDGELPARQISLELNDGQHVLHDGTATSRWHIAQREIRITDSRALDDATHIHARDSVPLTWAVPLEGRREEAGRFWAFFPTQTATYIPGILNAPWKLNSDRNAIIGGEWNAALMAEAAQVVTESLPALSTPDDPARPLDAFPRQMDRKDDDAAPLVEAVWRALESAVVVPDATGTLRAGRELWRHPRDSAELACYWQSLASSESMARFTHPSCLERQRNSRINALEERFGEPEDAAAQGMLRKCEATSWFEEIASVELTRATTVLQLAEAYASDCKPVEWGALREHLAIIPSQDGRLVTASRALLAPEGTAVPDRTTVASALYNDSDARRILAEVLKVQAPDDNMWKQVLAEALRDIPRYQPETDAKGWKAFWSRLRQAPKGARDQFLQSNGREIRICRRDDTWVSADEVLLPGVLIGADDTSANQKVLVDDTVHHGDRVALAVLGVCEMPEGDVKIQKSAIFQKWSKDWLSACRTLYKKTHNNSATRGYLKPDSLMMPKGFAFLPQLSGAPNALLTKQYLSRLALGKYDTNVEFGHCTTKAYPKMDVSHPLPWFLLRHGSIEIGNTTVSLAALVARWNESVLPMSPALAEWSNAFEKLQDPFPTVQSGDDDIHALWRAFFADLATFEAVASDTLTDLWTASALAALSLKRYHRRKGRRRPKSPKPPPFPNGCCARWATAASPYLKLSARFRTWISSKSACHYSSPN